MYSIYLLVTALLCNGASGVLVSIQQGTLQGEQLRSVTGSGKYYSFKGIPYATPPVGGLRFKAPQPAIPWRGVLNATKFGSECPQKDDYTNVYIPGNEDCLFLNVYSPNLKPRVPMAVLVFIDGQGFKSRFASNDFYGPDFLVDEDVILVTFNQRFGALGYLSLDTCDVPGNAGLKDQVAVLKWVRDNIRSFGGDPNKVTLYGKGSGAVSISLHMVSPMSKGLFQGVILSSGVWEKMRSFSFEYKRRAFRLGLNLGIDTKDPNELVRFLQTQPVRNIVLTDPSLLTSDVPSFNIVNMYYYAPVVETANCGDAFLPAEPEQLMISGLVNDVNIIIGHTDQECLYTGYVLEKQLLQYFSLYEDLNTPWVILSQVTPKQLLDISDRIEDRYFVSRAVTERNLVTEYIPYCSEAHVINDIFRYVNNLPKSILSKIFMYQFSYLSERNIYSIRAQRLGMIGTTYGDDLLYSFNPKGVKFNRKNSKTYRQIKTNCALITNFAKYGNPTPDASLGVIWPEYTEEGYYLEINDTLTVRRTNNANEIQFWDSIHQSVTFKEL